MKQSFSYDAILRNTSTNSRNVLRRFSLNEELHDAKIKPIYISFTFHQPKYLKVQDYCKHRAEGTQHRLEKQLSH